MPKLFTQESHRRVLVVGSSNVGKTSMLNELCSLNLAVSNDARGCTLNTERLPLQPHRDHFYTFFDTVGLNETDKGSVTSEKAIDNIIHLINNAREGFSLIIFVIRIGTIHNTDKTNYDLFANILTHQRIPIICVITGCENEDPMTEYASRNSQSYESNDMKFRKIEATCFAKGGRLENLIYKTAREDSGKRVWNAIEEFSSERPIVTINDENIGIVIKRTWNKFCDWVNKPTWRIIINKDLYDILGRMGIQDDGQKHRIVESILQPTSKLQ